MFFDKQQIERYRDAWPQIFDIALGIIDFDTVAKQKALSDLQQELSSLDQQKKRLEKIASDRHESIELLVKRAKEARLIEESLSVDDAFDEISDIVQNGMKNNSIDFSIQQAYEALQTQREGVALQLAKLRRFKSRYKEYRNNLCLEEDALKPIQYIQKHFTEQTSGEYRAFLHSLSIELGKIKSAISDTQPFENDVDQEIKRLTAQLKAIDLKLKNTAHVDYRIIPTADKLIAFGELKAEYNHIVPSDNSTIEIEEAIAKKQQEVEELSDMIQSVSSKRALTIETLNDYIQTYISLSQDALDEYGQYNARFDYHMAALTLRKSKTAEIANISSSSDHLFLHLCLFAGLHHMLLSQDSRYIPSFLIIDQPSRPYFNTSSDFNYEESEKVITKKDDWTKVKNIFTLWDQFLSLILSQEKHFQVIMLEHVSKEAWEGCENVNLVDVFDGIHRALIPIGYPSSTEKE